MTTPLTPPRLYSVTSVAGLWPHGREHWDGVCVTWFVRERETSPGYDYRKLIAGYDQAVARDRRDFYADRSEADPWEPPGFYARLLVDELFRGDEAAQLAAYLKSAHDTDAEVTEEPLPVAAFSPAGIGYFPVSAMPSGGPNGVCRLDTVPGYSLPFSVGGYYDMRQEPAPLRVQRDRGGRPEVVPW